MERKNSFHYVGSNPIICANKLEGLTPLVRGPVLKTVGWQRCHLGVRIRLLPQNSTSVMTSLLAERLKAIPRKGVPRNRDHRFESCIVISFFRGWRRERVPRLIGNQEPIKLGLFRIQLPLLETQRVYQLVVFIDSNVIPKLRSLLTE